MILLDHIGLTLGTPELVAIRTSHEDVFSGTTRYRLVVKALAIGYYATLFAMSHIEYARFLLFIRKI